MGSWCRLPSPRSWGDARTAPVSSGWISDRNGINCVSTPSAQTSNRAVGRSRAVADRRPGDRHQPSPCCVRGDALPGRCLTCLPESQNLTSWAPQIPTYFLKPREMNSNTYTVHWSECSTAACAAVKHFTTLCTYFFIIYIHSIAFLEGFFFVV